jgi:anaerobic magnesium-protoporphyrin IX monomethyl ester cyclase
VISEVKNEKSIILLDPPAYHGKYTRVSRHLIPNIGMAYIAAKLRAEGRRVIVLDPVADGIPADSCVANILDAEPWLIGISAMTHNVADAGCLAADLKRKNPGITIILGGVHVTSVPLETMRQYANIDYGVFGEGEDSITALVNHIAGGAGLPGGIPGIVFRDGANMINNPAPENYVDLDALPFPAWDLFPIDRYSPIYGLNPGTRQLPLSTSRGCPYNCIFCNNVNGSKMRYRSIDGVMAEIEKNIVEFKVGSLQFVDESLTFDMERCARLFESMIAKGYGERLKWACQTRVDRLSPELLALMKRAGCAFISIGIESGNQEIVNRTQKHLDLSKVHGTVESITRAGISADALFLIGLPYETPRTIIETIRFARSLKTKHASFSNVMPYPGTKIQEMGKTGEGGVRVLATDWSMYGRHLNYVMELETVSVSRLKCFHFLAYFCFYFTPGRIGVFFRKVNPLMLPLYLFSLIFRSRPKSNS